MLYLPVARGELVLALVEADFCKLGRLILVTTATSRLPTTSRVAQASLAWSLAPQRGSSTVVDDDRVVAQDG